MNDIHFSPSFLLTTDHASSSYGQPVLVNRRGREDGDIILKVLLSITGLCFSAGLLQASGEPALLAEAPGRVTVVVGPAINETIIGMQFYIGERPMFPTSYAGGTFLRIDETVLSTATIGGNLRFDKGQLGSFDFTVTNTPSFAHVASLLSDGKGRAVESGGFGYNADRISVGGGVILGGRGLQAAVLDSTITLFRLIVSEVDWGIKEGTFQTSGRAKWLIYGYPPPMPPPPTPPTLRLDRAPLGALMLSWPTQACQFVLQSGPDPVLPMTNFPTLPTLIGTNNAVLISPSEQRAFFHLMYSP